MKELQLTGYSVQPSVVRVGVPTIITISPHGDNTNFNDDDLLDVVILGVSDAAKCENDRFCFRQQIHTHNGKLIFTHTFVREQQYVIKVLLPEKYRWCSNPYYNMPWHGKVPRPMDIKSPVLYVYAVNDDLFGLKAYKGDFHIHSYDADGHESNMGLLANLKKAGYDFATLINRYCTHSAEKVKCVMTRLPDIFTVLPGEEVYIASEHTQALSVFTDRSVVELYALNKAQCDAEIANISAALPQMPADIGAYNYAVHVWIAQTIHKSGGVSILSHTHQIWNDVYNMPEALTQKLFEEGVYDVYELLNSDGGSDTDRLQTIFNYNPIPNTNHLQTAFYYDELQKGFTMPIVGSSDELMSDAPDERYPTAGYTLVFAPSRTDKEIRRAVLNSNAVAVWDPRGHTVNRRKSGELYQIYGSYRLVKYADFLIRNYFPLYAELCHEQGVLLKEYETNPSEDIAGLLAKLKKRSDDFSNQYFGISAPNIQ